MTSAVDVAELARIWAVLGVVERGSEVVAAPLDLTTSAGKVLVGASYPDRRHLLVPVGLDWQEAEPVEGVISIGVRTLVFDGTEGRYLEVWCGRRDLFPVFDDLLISVTNDLANSASPADIALEALARWRELLRAAHRPSLSPAAELGLWGELWTLEHLVESGRRIDSAFWRGPLGEPKDIDLGPAWLEVKTYGPSSSAITVHGLGQLDDSDGRPGWVVLVEVDESDDGRTLDQLARALLDAGSVLPSETFEELLLACGALGASSRKLRCTDVRLVPVALFPRLVESMVAGGVPDGIDAVAYDVSLESLRGLGQRGPAALAVVPEVET